MVDVKSSMFASSFASNLARVWQKLTKYLNTHLVMTLLVRRKPTIGLTGLKMARHQLMIMKNILEDQPAQH
jgi:hypothetical protein